MTVGRRYCKQRHVVPDIVAKQHQKCDREGDGTHDEEEAPRTLPPEPVPVAVLSKSTRLQRVASIVKSHFFGVNDVGVDENADKFLKLCSESITN